MRRIGLAMLWAAAVWGQTQLDVRLRLRGTAAPGESAVWSERVVVMGQQVRIASAEHLLIVDGAKGTVVLARGTDSSFVRTTETEFLAVFDRLRSGREVGVWTAGKSETAAAPPFVWAGGPTEGSGCRYRMTSEGGAVVSDSTVYFYTVPSEGATGKVLAATARLRRASPGGLSACLPSGRVAVRTVEVIEVYRAEAPERRSRWESVFDVDVLPGATVGAELFRVPEDFTEGAPGSLEERVREYLRAPAGIQ